MAQPDVAQMLRARFEGPLDECACRRIVFWHDAEGSFGDLFDQLAEQGLGTARAVSFAKAEEGGMFALKRRLYRQEPDTDFLVYTRAPKDLSGRGLEGDWLADVELVAEHFQADYASMLASSLGAEDDAVQGIKDFSAFFNAADRRKRFKALQPHAQSRSDIAIGVIAAVLGAADLSTEAVVRAYLCRMQAGNDPLAALERYGARDPFAGFIAKRTGFSGDLASAYDFAAHLLITALSAQVPQGALAGLEGRISPAHGQFCLNIVHAWMDSEADAPALYGLARRVEGLCNLPERFSGMNARDLASADVFPSINECLLAGLFASMAEGSDRADEAEAVLRQRKDLRWYSRLKERFDALGAAAAAQRFHRDHAGGFHAARAADAWKAYTEDWSRMDTCYRRFCQAFDACQRSSADVPVKVDDSLEQLATWMENTYVNWFLSESNACWTSCCEKAWEQAGYAEGIPRQNRFFADRVRGGKGQAKKTLVIASDALRFEVAREAAGRLERETQGSTTLSSVQAVFPSITEFGMAALLPHRTMSYSESEGVVYVNGAPADTTAHREALLKRADPSAQCVQSKVLMGMKRAERKERFGEAALVYVYHNQIDATGEEYATENKVFDACEDAIGDIVALVKIATNDLQFSRVLITADHGFLYTRRPLEERDKVAGADVGGDAALLGRRYAVVDRFDPSSPLFVKMNMSDIEGGDYTGIAPRECVRIKKAGPGDNYVHGGVSLQELCVPVVEFRNRRTGQKGFEEREAAGFKLLSTSRRISSMLFTVELLQEKLVGGKVLPAVYDLVVADASGNEVSDVRRASADRASTDAQERVSRVQFALKAGIAYDPRKPYYLVCRTSDASAVVWKEEFQIDIPFAPMDDFGF